MLNVLYTFNAYDLLHDLSVGCGTILHNELPSNTSVECDYRKFVSPGADSLRTNVTRIV